MLVAGSWSREGGEEAGHDRTKAHRKLNFEGFQVAGRSGHAPPGQPRTGGGTKSRCQRTVTHAARKTPPPPARQRQRPRRPSRGRPQAEPAEQSVLLYIGTYIASDIIKKNTPQRYLFLSNVLKVERPKMQKNERKRCGAERMIFP